MLYDAKGQAQQYIDVHAITIEPKDLIILRSDAPVRAHDLKELQETVLSSNPEWRGGLLVLKTDETIEKLDVTSLHNLYELLKSMFTDWEKYAAAWEAKEGTCVRCGHTVTQEKKTSDGAAK